MDVNTEDEHSLTILDRGGTRVDPILITCTCLATWDAPLNVALDAAKTHIRTVGTRRYEKAKQHWKRV